jgi:hypothetical protein
MRKAAFLAVVSLLLLGSGCVTKIYQGPTSGRAAEAQLTVAKSADRAFEKVELKALAGKRVLVQVYGLTERFETESPEEAFVRGLLVQKLLEQGAKLAPSLDDADVLLAVTLRAAGVDIHRRDVPFIYNHHVFEAETSARLVAYTLANKVASGIVFSTECDGTALYRERYIFYFIGPLQSRE